LDSITPILNNVVVQVLLGIGAMVFLISVGEAISKALSSRARARSAEEKQLVQSLQKELVSLRQEFEELRSLSVEHSMSLDRNVEILEQRVQRLEDQASDRETLR
jgi:TolA-binding protein